MEHYDQMYEIFDHEAFDSVDPMSIIGMHPAENPVTGSRLETMARELIVYRIPELTNTPLLELMDYPRWFLEKLLQDGRKARVKEDTVVDEIERQQGTKS